jgi:hypothetical protein
MKKLRGKILTFYNSPNLRAVNLTCRPLIFLRLNSPIKNIILIFLPDQIHSRIPYNEGQKKAAGCLKSIICYPFTVSHLFSLLLLILYNDKTYSLESKLLNHSFSILFMTASKLSFLRFGTTFMRSHSLNMSVFYGELLDELST